MRFNAIKCKLCEDIIYSRSRHDCRSCTCGAVAIDGGQESYSKISGSEWDHAVVDLPLTLKDLYDDWNKEKDKYGLIKPKKVRRATKTKS